MIKCTRYLALKSIIAPLTAIWLSSGCAPSAPTDPQTQNLPQPLSQAEPIPNLAAGSCAAGGLRLYHGLDYNRDGRLSVYERHREETICNPAPLDISPTNGVALGKPKVVLPEDG